MSSGVALCCLGGGSAPGTLLHARPQGQPPPRGNTYCAPGNRTGFPDRRCFFRERLSEHRSRGFAGGSRGAVAEVWTPAGPSTMCIRRAARIGSDVLLSHQRPDHTPPTHPPLVHEAYVRIIKRDAPSGVDRGAILLDGWPGPCARCWSIMPAGGVPTNGTPRDIACRSTTRSLLTTSEPSIC